MKISALTELARAFEANHDEDKAQRQNLINNTEPLLLVPYTLNSKALNPKCDPQLNTKSSIKRRHGFLQIKSHLWEHT